MLIEKRLPLATGDIAALRLVSGEEVVGKITIITDATITITKPILVQIQMVSANQAGVGFAPYSAAADEDAKFIFSFANLAHYPLHAAEQIKANYIKATSSIEIAQAGTLLK